MRLPSSKFFVTLLLLSFCLMVLLSFVGNNYEKQILQHINAELAAKLAKVIFLFLGSIFAISSMTLFIRHFPGKIIKVIAIENPELAKKLSKILNSAHLDRFAFSFNILIILGALYIGYAIQNDFA